MTEYMSTPFLQNTPDFYLLFSRQRRLHFSLQPLAETPDHFLHQFRRKHKVLNSRVFRRARFIHPPDQSLFSTPRVAPPPRAPTRSLRRLA